MAGRPLFVVADAPHPPTAAPPTPHRNTPPPPRPETRPLHRRPTMSSRCAALGSAGAGPKAAPGCLRAFRPAMAPRGWRARVHGRPSRARPGSCAVSRSRWLPTHAHARQVWLHPCKYKTQLCADGGSCQRKVRPRFQDLGRLASPAHAPRSAKQPHPLPRTLSSASAAASLRYASSPTPRRSCGGPTPTTSCPATPRGAARGPAPRAPAAPAATAPPRSRSRRPRPGRRGAALPRASSWLARTRRRAWR
jgi:hypothetical protein